MNGQIKNNKFLTIATAICMSVLLSLFIVTVTYFNVTTCYANSQNDDSTKIGIIYTNDTHCYINEEHDEKGKLTNMGYAYLKGVVNAYKNDASYAGINVVSGGDDISGGLDYGLLSKGQWTIDLMNAIPYDVVTPGNHEFDYGVPCLDDLYRKELDKNTSYITCNFADAHKTEFPMAHYDLYCIKQVGGKKIVYMEISTPESLVKSSPKNFIDEDGNYKYTFYEDETGQALYDKVQDTINFIKELESPDLIVAVGHTGNEENITERWRTENIIANTEGIDLYLDGHSHQKYIENFKDRSNKDVPTIQTGTAFERIGVIDIEFEADNTKTITAKNLKPKDVESIYDHDAYDNLKNGLLADINNQEQEAAGEIIGTSEVDLTKKDRACQECILGDYCADSYRYVYKTDIGIMNSGGVRSDLNHGDVKVQDMMSVNSFANELVAIETPGQRILDALELGAMNFPESGILYQVSGLTYEINLDVKTSVVLDEYKNMIDITGERRVQNVKVNGVPLDPNKKYSVAGSCYVLTDKGEGQTAFSHGDSKMISQPGPMKDYEALCYYIKGSETEGGLNGLISKEKYGAPSGRIVGVHKQSPYIPPYNPPIDDGGDSSQIYDNNTLQEAVYTSESYTSTSTGDMSYLLITMIIVMMSTSTVVVVRKTKLKSSYLTQ